MKTMTCRRPGWAVRPGAPRGTADEIINAQDHHLKAAEKAGDASHQEARDAMKGRWRHPKRSLDWYNGVKRAFAELPDSAG